MALKTFLQLYKVKNVRISLLLGGLLAMVAGLGLQSLPATAATPVPPPLQWGRCPAPPEGLPDAGQECATLVVPKDYRNPNGEKIQIAVSRVTSAKPSERRGVLFSNPGGPGGAGVDLPRVFSTLMPKEVLDRYDLIGFDPRGIGYSTTVSCGLNLREVDQVYVPLEQPGGFSATTNLMRQTAERCRQTSGNLLPFITTPNTARDMEQLRLALGEPKISYLGYSYGTALGATYASLYPNRTDRFVLDSSVGTSWQWREQFRSWKLSDHSRWPDFANFLAANDATYHFGSTPNAVRSKYFELFAKMNQSPITLSDGTIMNGPMFMELTFGGFYSDAFFPDAATTWQIADGQLQPEAGAAAVLGLKRRPPTPTVPEDSSAAAGLAILCGDTAWSRNVTQYQHEYTADKTQYPLFGALGSNIWACAFWANPIEPPVPVTPLGPANGMLIVQNLRDPATPLPGALQMRAALGQRARMITVDQGGHAIYLLSPNSCANARVTDYLVAGTLPLSDTLCPADPPAVQQLLTSTPEKNQAIRNLITRIR
jgi:pimeloyl-ACP methyl ester carboxylesterase